MISQYHWLVQKVIFRILIIWNLPNLTHRRKFILKFQEIPHCHSNVQMNFLPILQNISWSYLCLDMPYYKSSSAAVEKFHRPSFPLSGKITSSNLKTKWKSQPLFWNNLHYGYFLCHEISNPSTPSPPPNSSNSNSNFLCTQLIILIFVAVILLDFYIQLYVHHAENSTTCPQPTFSESCIPTKLKYLLYTLFSPLFWISACDQLCHSPLFLFCIT